MAKANPRLDAARKAYREALEAARASPTPEAWARLLAAGKDLSAAQEVRPRSSRRRRGASTHAPPPGSVRSPEETADLEGLE